MPQKSIKHLGKIGFIIIAIGMIILFYDAFRINQMYPVNYIFYEHSEIYVPLGGMAIAFLGTSLFIFNFIKGRTVF